MINFVLIINEAGRVLFSYNFQKISKAAKTALHSDVARKCFIRTKNECHFFEHQDMTIIYRSYGPTMVIIGATEDENELAIYEFINLFMETLDMYFQKVTESHIISNLDKVHLILQEMVVNGNIMGTSVKRNLLPIYTIDRLATN